MIQASAIGSASKKYADKFRNIKGLVMRDGEKVMKIRRGGKSE